MKNILVSFYLAGIHLLLIGCGDKHSKDSTVLAKKENENKLPDSTLHSDANFAVTTAEINSAELGLGKLCETHASLDTVLKFGRTIVKNYSVIDEQLKAWANSENVSLPNGLSETDQKNFDQLSAKKGRDFDKEFTLTTIRDHNKILNAYRIETQNGKDTLLKAWAREKIIILEANLQTASWIKTELEKPPLKSKE